VIEGAPARTEPRVFEGRSPPDRRSRRRAGPRASSYSIRGDPPSPSSPTRSRGSGARQPCTPRRCPPAPAIDAFRKVRSSIVPYMKRAIVAGHELASGARDRPAPGAPPPCASGARPPCGHATRARSDGRPVQRLRAVRPRPRHPLPARRARHTWRWYGRGTSVSGVRGHRIENVVPCSSLVRTTHSAPCACAICCTMYRPSPSPLDADPAPRRNASTAGPRLSAGYGGPASRAAAASPVSRSARSDSLFHAASRSS
jgi:hypothetical protein